jgi:hypothetical protein
VVHRLLPKSSSRRASISCSAVTVAGGSPSPRPLNRPGAVHIAQEGIRISGEVVTRYGHTPPRPLGLVPFIDIL